MGETQMKIVSYEVVSFSFEQPTTIDIKKGEIPPQASLNVANRFGKLDDNRAKVELKCLAEGPKNFNYSLVVTVGAVFECEQFEQSKEKTFMMKNNTLSILYPYLRSTVASLSALAGIPIITLPVINTLSFFGDQTEKRKDTK